MSLETLLKNFGEKKRSELASQPVIAQPTDESSCKRTQFESLDDQSACEECGNNFFWRYKNWWFCGRCRKPPAIDFVHEVRNGEFVKWIAWRKAFKYESKRATDEELAIEKTDSVAVDAYDSVIVVEGAEVCPECPCMWAREHPQDNGRVHRTCYACGAVIGQDKRGVIPDFSKAPTHLLPFWKWFNERSRS